ncbi:hypothetical protein FACS1894102_0900 [Spirochaetia bacterium]|nr:hypothetical protein FACS1894102_0900 [Spirochaetia bacterium]
MGLSMREKQALTGEVAKRYRKAKKAEKSRILSEFVANSGYNRKYAIHILTHEGKVKNKRIDGELVAIKIAHKQKKKRLYKRYYDEPVEKSVLAIWWFFDMMCGQRLVPLIRANIENLVAEPFFEIDEVIKKKLQEISVSTVERMLKPERKKLKLRGTCTTTPGTMLKSQIPIRVYFDWDERLPGFFEIDTVAHDGGVASGEY